MKASGTISMQVRMDGGVGPSPTPTPPTPVDAGVRDAGTTGPGGGVTRLDAGVGDGGVGGTTLPRFDAGIR